MPEITINGVTYRSCYAAAKALGLSRKTLETRLKRGIPLSAPVTPTESRPVVVNGKHYPSIRAAARAFKVLPGCIHKQIKQQGLVLDFAPNPRRRPITIDGKLYPSVAEASRQTGIPWWKLIKVYPPEASGMAPRSNDGTIHPADIPH